MPTYLTTGVRFDTDAVDRNLAFSGAVDGKQGMFSIWLRMTGNDGATQIIFVSRTIGTFSNVGLQRLSSNKIAFFLYNADGVTAAFDVVSTTQTITADGLWHHIIFSWDATTGVIQAYYDGAVMTLTTNASGNVFIEYAATRWRYCANDGPTIFTTADLDEVYFNIVTNLDLSVAANLAKFWSNEGFPAGKPVNLGSDGSTPTGTAPIMYMRGPDASFPTNLGTGGDFSNTIGDITDAPAPQPSDSRPVPFIVRRNQNIQLVAQ